MRALELCSANGSRPSSLGRALMCGIAGIAACDRSELEPIAAMTRALRHRGPDDEGYLLADSNAGRAQAFSGADTIGGLGHPRLPSPLPEGFELAFGHRRLSII